MRIPKRRKDGGHDGFTNFAPEGIRILAGLAHDLPQRFGLLGFGGVV